MSLNHCQMKDTTHLNTIDYLNSGVIQNAATFAKSQQKSIQNSPTDTEQHSKIIYFLFYSSLQSYLSNQPDALGDIDDLIQVMLQIAHQLQPHPVQPQSNVHIELQRVSKYDSKPRDEAKQNDSIDNFEADTKLDSAEPVPTEEVQDDNISQDDDDNIFDKLDEFVSEYNKYRPMNRQLNADAVIRCFRENDMDHTEFRDLNSNLKKYGIRAGPARKLWRYLNPVEMNKNEQDDENVVVIPIGSYTSVNTEYESILFEYNDIYEFMNFDFGEDSSVSEDDGICFGDDIDESIELEFGENLSVPSDWSNDNE